MGWPRTWKLNKVEREELKALTDGLGEPPAWAGAIHPMRALRRPATDDDAMIERRKQLALQDYVTAIDQHLARALRSFMPDELWELLHALEVAETGTAAARVRALEEGAEEYGLLAGEAVEAWKELRRAREKILEMATKRGLRGWDDPTQQRYLNSAPLESDSRTALMAIERSLLQRAGQRVALWLSVRDRVRLVRRSKRQGTTMRREVVSLLSAADLGYARIASLATSPLWRRRPCPKFEGAVGKARLVAMLKADLGKNRRGNAVWSAPIEV